MLHDPELSYKLRLHNLHYNLCIVLSFQMPGPHLLLVVVAVCLIKTASGFANGKVSLSCGDMTPRHGHDSSSKPAPYNITLDKHTFSPGDRITGSLLYICFCFFIGILLFNINISVHIGVNVSELAK